ncbi:hypothetical protein [Bradyrhizobium sp. CCBAU 45384]|nr:hypothetical protein [Bradyrhizobium sp. CCBAU 45384]
MQLDLLAWPAPFVEPPNSTMRWTVAEEDRLTELYVETGGISAPSPR